MTVNLPTARRSACIAVLLAVAGSLNTAQAGPIPAAARYAERASCSGVPTVLGADPFGPETVHSNGIDCFAEAATGSSGVALTPGPLRPALSAPWARAVLNTRGDGGGVVGASVNYEWGVGLAPGGVAGAAVPVIIHAYLELEFDRQTASVPDLFASIILGNRGFSRTACTGTPIVCSEYHVALDLPVSMIADGDPAFIALVTSAHGGGDLAMRAVADPFIEIAPDFADRDLYRIVLSPGIEVRLPPTPGNGVPEPATVTLLGLGLAALAGLRRSAG